MDKQHHRTELLGNVLAMFSRYGIRSVTMDDISRELGVSKKTLYQHVADKNDLIDRVIELELVQKRSFMEELNGSTANAIDQLIQVNRQIHSTLSSHNPTFYYDLKKYYPEIFRKWMDARRKRMFELITSNMNKGKQEGLYRKNLNENVIARLYLARMEMLNDNEIILEEESDSVDFIREIFIYHLHGICNATGLKYLESQSELK